MVSPEIFLMNVSYSEPVNPDQKRALVVVFSYHHHNTEKIAHAIAHVLDAEVRTPQQVIPEEIASYPLIGFGSGIYDATFAPSVIELADRLPRVSGTNVFLFSTYGAPSIVANRAFIEKNHQKIREKLEAKGYTVIGEFGCAGWNTNSFLRFFGGINKGKPDAGDLRNTEIFAREMMQKFKDIHPGIL
jgi:flavodoxin